MGMKRIRWIIVGAVIMLGLLVAALATLRPAQAQSGLAEARARWGVGGPASYRLRLTQQTNRGACDQEMLTEAERATPLRNSCGQPANWTVPRLFNWIAELERNQSSCYPDPSMCACRGSTTTTVRYDATLGFPREIVYEWRKQPNPTNVDYWRSLFDRSFPGCNRDGRGGPVMVSVTLIEEP
jgi:hypothetical protein